MSAQRKVVDAFFAAGRSGKFEQLIAVLHPDVVLRADFGGRVPALGGLTVGAEAVARRAAWFAQGRQATPATVNGTAGAVITMDGHPVAIMDMTVVDGRIVAIDVLGDPERLAALSSTTALNLIATQYARARPRSRVNPATALNGYQGLQTVQQGAEPVVQPAAMPPTWPTSTFWGRTGMPPW